ncbi:MAG TPA: secretin and TonB N-terminal domain-containing protein [Thermoanaerobaculia bacterium]|nr:secretin and TonB N-terminal domain-containing protein [Thermoanaerobaculia bacterium]
MRTIGILMLALLLSASAAAGQTRPSGRSARARKSTTPRPTLRYDAARAAESRWAGEPISLDVKDADLRDILHTFSELTGLNMVVDPEVRGSVTVRLQDVPWDQALDLILRTNGLGYVLEGNILRVGKPSNL